MDPLIDSLLLALKPLVFGPPVTHVYNPLVYARRGYERYLERFGRPPREVLLVGMNPGPWGMAQTGVPFGDVALVRDWMGIREAVGQPERVHARRPVLGFDCRRGEGSGRRLWGWARDRFGTPERFFERFFVVNYCPLMFIEAQGGNRTPDRLPRAERDPLLSVCDRALRDMVLRLRPTHVVGVGRFAAQRCALALEGLDVVAGRIPHPSPASPQANRDWAGQAERAFRDMGVALT